VRINYSCQERRRKTKCGLTTLGGSSSENCSWCQSWKIRRWWIWTIRSRCWRTKTC